MNLEETSNPTITESEEMWKKVQYIFSSYVQFTSTGTEFLILFGERLPPRGEVRPQMGITMTPPQAIAMLGAFEAAVQRMVESVKQAAKERKAAALAAQEEASSAATETKPEAQSE